MKLRLCYIIPFIKTWSQAINLGMQPNNIYNTISKLSESIDLIMSIKDDKYYDMNKDKLQSNIDVKFLFKFYLNSIASLFTKIFTNENLFISRYVNFI